MRCKYFDSKNRSENTWNPKENNEGKRKECHHNQLQGERIHGC